MKSTSHGEDTEENHEKEVRGRCNAAEVACVMRGDNADADGLNEERCTGITRNGANDGQKSDADMGCGRFRNAIQHLPAPWAPTGQGLTTNHRGG